MSSWPLKLGFGTKSIMPSFSSDGRPDFSTGTDLLRKAIELGIRYIDTSIEYPSMKRMWTERLIGQSIKSLRVPPTIFTKALCHHSDEKRWMQNIETSLSNLGLPSLEFYGCHNLTKGNFDSFYKGKVHRYLEQARKKGLIRKIGISTHEHPEHVKEFIDSGMFDLLMVSYNMIDRSLERQLEHAKARGMTTVVMTPLLGGTLLKIPHLLSMVGNGEKILSLSLRFLFLHPHIDLIVCGFLSPQELELNLKLDRSSPLSSLEISLLDHIHRERLGRTDNHCTGCGYCLPCPVGINIPEWIQGSGAPAPGPDSCVQCLECEKRCPFRVPISERLRALNFSRVTKTKWCQLIESQHPK